MKQFVIASIAVLFLTTSSSGQTWKEMLKRADSLTQIADYDSAITITTGVLRGVNIQENLTDTIKGEAYYHLGSNYYYTAHYVDAESLLQKAMQTRIKNFGENSSQVLEVMNQLIALYLDWDKLAEAETLVNKEIKMDERYNDFPDELRAISYEKIAKLFMRRMKYDEAHAYLERSLFILQSLHGTEHPLYAATLLTLSIYFDSMGQFDKADSIAAKSIAILERILPPIHPQISRGLNQLSRIKREKGELTIALSLGRRALFIAERIFGEFHPDVALSINQIANAYYQLLIIDSAAQLYETVLMIYKKIFREDHSSLARSMNNLANVYSMQKRYEKAMQMSQNATKLREQIAGVEHRSVGDGLLTMASIYTEMGDFIKAESLVNRALYIREKWLGSYNYEIAEVLETKLQLFLHQKKHHEASLISKRAIDIRRQTTGLKNAKLGWLLAAQAYCLRLENKIEESLITATDAIQIYETNIATISSSNNENEALVFTKLYHSIRDIYLSSFIDAHDNVYTSQRRTAEIVLSSKGIISDALFKKIATSKTHPNYKITVKALNDITTEIATLYFQGPLKENVTTYQQELDSLLRNRKEIETKKLQYSSTQSMKINSDQISVNQISTILPPESNLIEYVSYNYVEQDFHTSNLHYIALTINKKGSIFIIDLGRADTIDLLIKEYKRHFNHVESGNPSSLSSRQAEFLNTSVKLYNLLWKPIEKNIQSNTTLFIAPDGELNLLSFATLMDSEGKYLIEKHPIHYLSAGRDLLRFKGKTERSNGFIAFGDPDFNAPASSRLLDEQTAALSAHVPSDPYETRNVRSGCAEFRNLSVQPLPASRGEVTSADEFYRRAYPVEKTSLFLGRDASEDYFKRYAPGHRTLHLATHGFYLEGNCSQGEDAGKSLITQRFTGENPLLLSGLLFAGANLHGRNADSLGSEDGILTALEVSALDLRGTDLVVLSACETGLGEVKAGEGVYGLRRAFQMAGAKTIISALWQVPDQSTMQFMKTLYSQQAKTYPELMQKTALRQLKELRLRDKPIHPYTWGAFIATGDWKIR